MVGYEPYTCPRCGYNTKDKSNMKSHFYKKKNVCPGIKNANLILTDTIKEYVLKNRIYVQNSISQVQSSQFLINFINNLGIQSKHKYLEDHIVVPRDLLTSIEEKYKIENAQYERGDGLDLTKDELIASVSKAVKAENQQDLNVFHDGTMMWIKTHKTLDEVDVVIGVKEIIKTIYDSYWHKYECYLASRHYNTRNEREKSYFRELLELYYNFLVCLELPPYSKTAENSYLIESLGSDDGFDISRSYYKIYETTLKNVKRSDMSKTQKEVKQIIISQCKSNKKELNKAILNLVKKDQIYKNKLLTLQ